MTDKIKDLMYFERDGNFTIKSKKYWKEVEEAYNKTLSERERISKKFDENARSFLAAMAMGKEWYPDDEKNPMDETLDRLHVKEDELRAFCKEKGIEPKSFLSVKRNPVSLEKMIKDIDKFMEDNE